MFPFVLVIGFLVVRKIRKFHLFFSFIILSLISTLIFAALNKGDLFQLLPIIITSYPILFLGTVMLTEPSTMPPSRKHQMFYGGIVGLLSGVQFHLGPIFATPELALLIGNTFSYAVSFKKRLVFTLKEKIQISQTVFEFIFSPSSKFAYFPGQYLEWTLRHKKSDSRGIRRFFTIASSPTEGTVSLGIKIDPEHISSFKKALLNLNPGEEIYAGQLAGEFILPKKLGKYVFIAGGIGITPFRSMVKSAIDKNEKLDAILFYSSRDEKDFAFEQVFENAESLGLRTIYICSNAKSSWKGKTGRIDEKMIKEEVDDYKSRVYYLSGPDIMVNSYKKLLRNLEIKPDKIIADYFPGY